MAGKKKYSFRKLEEMNEDEYFALINDIPSDTASDIGDCSDEEYDLDEAAVTNCIENDLFDINALEVIFADDTLQENVHVFAADEATEQDEELYDSDDNISLAVLRRNLLQSKTIWTRDSNNCVQNKKTFCETTGPNIAEKIESPTDIFLHIFPSELIEHIVFQTNLYALQNSGGETNSFLPTNLEEMKVFIAINLLMGIKPLPSLRDYWSSRMELRDSFICSCMPRDRFLWLLKNLHLNDNSIQPEYNQPNFDKLYKVRPLLDKLSETFISANNPSKNQAIDESMIKFKGRSSLRQYMPMKPIKRGYKVWVRADESGFVCQFQIYTGKVSDITEKKLGARVVKDLTRCLVGKGYNIYFDNYFNSVELQKSLLADFIYSCGTVRKGRKDTPSDIKEDSKLVRGQSDWRVSEDGITFLKWKDRKGVLFLSNHQDPSKNDTVSRKKKDGSKEQITCPKLVKEYNANMGYVDKMDMLKSIYEIDRKSKKWWHRIFWYFIDVSLVNAFILYKNRSNCRTLNLKLFRLSVILGLIGASPDLPKRGRKRDNIGNQLINSFKPTVPLEIRYDKCAHMPVHGKPRRCAHCSSRKEPHKSSWSCSTCNVGLCLNDKKNCFTLYHSK